MDVAGLTAIRTPAPPEAKAVGLGLTNPAEAGWKESPDEARNIHQPTSVVQHGSEFPCCPVRRCRTALRFRIRHLRMATARITQPVLRRWAAQGRAGLHSYRSDQSAGSGTAAAVSRRQRTTTRAATRPAMIRPIGRTGYSSQIVASTRAIASP